MKNKALFLGIFLGLLVVLFPAITAAMTPFAQDTDISQSAANAFYNDYSQINLGTGLSGTLSSIDLHFVASSTISNAIFIEYDTLTDYQQNKILTGSIRVLGASCAINSTGSATATTSFAGSCFGSPTFTATKWYSFFFQTQTTNTVFGKDFDLRFGTSTPMATYGYFGTPNADNSQRILLATPFFRLNGVTGPDVNWFGATSTTPTISLLYPTSTTPDFSNWVVDVTNASSGSIIGVRYNQTGATTTPPYSFYDDSAQFTLVSAVPLRIKKSNLLWFPPLLMPQTWYATPYIIPLGTSTPIFGSRVQFNIDNVATPTSTTITDAAAPFNTIVGGMNYPTTTTSTANMTMTCDSASGFFQYSLCYLFQGLFVPSPTILNSWSNLWSDINTKPPFGYSAYFSAAANISTATSSAFTLPDWSGIQFFQQLRAIISTALYLAFGFWVIHRIRHLQL